MPARLLEDKELSRGALRTYGAISLHAKDGRAWPRVSLLAEELGADRRQVQRWIAELAAGRWPYLRVEPFIRPTGGFGANTYVLTDFDDATVSTASGATKITAGDATESTATSAVEITASLTERVEQAFSEQAALTEGAAARTIVEADDRGELSEAVGSTPAHLLISIVRENNDFARLTVGQMRRHRQELGDADLTEILRVLRSSVPLDDVPSPAAYFDQIVRRWRSEVGR
jgi:hypothetical protein